MKFTDYFRNLFGNKPEVNNALNEIETRLTEAGVTTSSIPGVNTEGSPLNGVFQDIKPGSTDLPPKPVIIDDPVESSTPEAMAQQQTVGDPLEIDSNYSQNSDTTPNDTNYPPKAVVISDPVASNDTTVPGGSDGLSSSVVTDTPSSDVPGWATGSPAIIQTDQSTINTGTISNNSVSSASTPDVSNNNVITSIGAAGEPGTSTTTTTNSYASLTSYSNPDDNSGSVPGFAGTDPSAPTASSYSSKSNYSPSTASTPDVSSSTVSFNQVSTGQSGHSSSSSSSSGDSVSTSSHTSSSTEGSAGQQGQQGQVANAQSASSNDSLATPGTNSDFPEGSSWNTPSSNNNPGQKPTGDWAASADGSTSSTDSGTVVASDSESNYTPNEQ